ncbi:MAG: hypothetical protein AAF432_01965 [Planctomycetota bacterium]
MSRAIVRRATMDDIERVMSFIHHHWRADHILSRDRTLVEFQHVHPDTGDVDIVIAERPGDTDLIGMLGFIRSSRYDPALRDQDAVFLALWNVRPDANEGPLGLRLHHHVASLTSDCAHAVNGINDAVAPIYAAMGYTVTALTHVAMVNTAIKSTMLREGHVETPDSLTPSERATLHAVTCDELRDIASPLSSTMQHSQPARSAVYFAERYGAHPTYRYEILRAVVQDEDRALMAIREDRHGGATALRLVDFRGDVSCLPAIAPALQSIIRERNAEYLDAYAVGIDDATWQAAGFHIVDPDGPLIVPNYFSPFERRNVSITCAYMPADKPWLIMKADGDQDRPNVPASPGSAETSSASVMVHSKSRAGSCSSAARSALELDDCGLSSSRMCRPPTG